MDHSLHQMPAKQSFGRPKRGGLHDDNAVDLIITKTQGYPYFLQEWGKHT